jgi:hypothetical protein
MVTFPDDSDTQTLYASLTILKYAIFRLGFLPAVAGCLGLVPCDAYPQLNRSSGRCFHRRPFGY